MPNNNHNPRSLKRQQIIAIVLHVTHIDGDDDVMEMDGGS